METTKVEPNPEVEVSYHDDTLDLLPIWNRIKAKRRLVLSITGVLIAVSLVYTFIKTPVWEAKTVLLFPSRPASSGSAMMDALAAAGGGGSSSPIKVFSEILKSDKVRTYVAQHAKVNKEKLEKEVAIKEQMPSNSIVLTSKDTSTAKAQLILHSYVSALKELNAELNIPSIQGDASLLKKELDQKTSLLKTAEEKLQAFLERAKTAPAIMPASASSGGGFMPGPSRWAEQQKKVELELKQANALIQKINSQTFLASKAPHELEAALPPVKIWRRKLIQLQYDLKVKEISAGPESPEVVSLKKQIELTQSQLKTEVDRYLKTTELGASAQTIDLVTKKAGLEAELEGINRIVEQAPKEATEYQRLTREVALLSGTLQNLYTQYELVKLQAIKDPNRWQVLDDAVLSDKPINKQYGLRFAMGMVFGLFIGVSLALYLTRHQKN